MGRNADPRLLMEKITEHTESEFILLGKNVLAIHTPLV